jgi:hypothetical protein
MLVQVLLAGYSIRLLDDKKHQGRGVGNGSGRGCRGGQKLRGGGCGRGQGRGKGHGKGKGTPSRMQDYGSGRGIGTGSGCNVGDRGHCYTYDNYKQPTYVIESAPPEEGM